MPDTIQAITRLPLNSSWDRSATPFLMSPYTLSTRHQWFACAHLQISYLTGSLSCLFPWRSPPWLLINAAHGGLVTTSGSRHRRAHLHLSYSYEQNFLALMAHQIPACGITAPGSSELLASHLATQVFLEIMTYPWFDYFKVFDQCFKPNYIIASALTAPI